MSDLVPKSNKNSLGTIEPGQLCRSTLVMERLGMGANTWLLWKKAGLKVVTGLGTSAEFVFTDDLFAFIKSKPTINRRKKPKIAPTINERTQPK